MPRSAALDDSETRDMVVSHIAGGGPQATAGEALGIDGISRAAIARRCKTDPVFGERVRAARGRARTLGLERVRSAPADPGQRKTAALAVERDGDELGLPSVRWVVDLLKKTAQDPAAKGQPRAQIMLAELVVVPSVRARNAKLEVADAKPEPLQVRFIAPAQTKHPRVLDAVVVESTDPPSNPGCQAD